MTIPSKKVTADAEQVPVRRAILSVYDKRNLIDLGKALADAGVELVSTSGTAAKLRSEGLTVVDISTITGFPEILDGRVKTLHPKVYGGLLHVNGNAEHDTCMEAQGIRPIDLVVVNLYPFSQAVASGGDFHTCMENTDIGGPCMIRAAAKNCDSVCVLTDPQQYQPFIDELKQAAGCISRQTRRRLAQAAFSLTASYDAMIASYFQEQPDADDATTIVQSLTKVTKLKYGLNPHQAAAVWRPSPSMLPFETLNGVPGYINLLDALNAWQLVRELQAATQQPAATSFKHVSPAGAAIGVELTADERRAFHIDEKMVLTPTAMAYVRARNSDPKCSFGEFIGLSCVVDAVTANLIKTEVADGIIAAGFEPEALEILKLKKSGNFIILQADAHFTPPGYEYREVFGVGLRQERNTEFLAPKEMTDIRSKRQDIPDASKLDLVVASIAVKYTQSNSVAYAKNGMTIGIGAGQQSRIDCVQLAGRKARTWAMRFHPEVVSLCLDENMKKHEKVNARFDFIDKMDESKIIEWMKKIKGVSLSSDAFFPFDDCILECAKYGVEHIIQPGGSVGDDVVIKACDDNNMSMVFSNLRLFHH